MKSRIPALMALTLLTALGTESRASILSASSQAVREPSTESAGFWTATTLQQELNASLRGAVESTAAAGPLASTREPIAGGGLMVNGSSSGVSYTPFTNSDALDDLFQVDNGSGVITRGAWDPNGPVIAGNGNHGGGRGRDNDRDRGRGRDRDRDRDRDRKDRDRDNPYATPEPSTWMLLGSGLLLLGAYAGLRRRQALSF